MICKQCLKDKLPEEFHTCKIKISGLSGKCKDCNNQNSRLQRIKDGSQKQRLYLLNRRRENKRKIVNYFNNCCFDCGIQDEPCIYDLHHKDPQEKEFGIAQYLDRVWEKILPEIEKCIMLCSNCHRKRHFSYKDETK